MKAAELRETKIKKELKKAAKKAPAEEIRELAGRSNFNIFNRYLEAAKKVIFFMAVPFKRGGGGKGLAIKFFFYKVPTAIKIEGRREVALTLFEYLNFKKAENFLFK